MTQEEKTILFQDLSARLPYEVKVFYEYVDDLDKKTYGYSLTLNTWCIDELVAEKAIVKPYLRPMSNMTGEESIEYGKTLTCHIGRDNCTYTHQTFKSFDWLNAHHFDYRGLIERGLALEAPEDMYNLNVGYTLVLSIKKKLDK